MISLPEIAFVLVYFLTKFLISNLTISHRGNQKTTKKISDIDLRELLLVLLLNIKKHGVGEIRGRTKMQKIMFILKNEFNLPQDFGYFLYTYGPYSALLQDEIDTLTTFGLVEEKTVHLFNFLRYEYFLSEHGEKAAKSVEKTLDSSEAEIIDKLAARTIELNEKALEAVIEEAYEHFE